MKPILVIAWAAWLTFAASWPHDCCCSLPPSSSANDEPAACCSRDESIETKRSSSPSKLLPEAPVRIEPSCACEPAPALSVPLDLDPNTSSHVLLAMAPRASEPLEPIFSASDRSVAYRAPARRTTFLTSMQLRL